MARLHRIHLPHGTYYVVQRGLSQRPIFRDEQDYEKLEGLLADTLVQYSAKIWAYCWTPPAIHMAIEIGTAPLARVMQSALGRYARNRNREMGAGGPFFADRYRATLLEPGNYLARLIRVIHQVPVHAGLAPRAEDYPYSSCNVYAGRGEKPWLTLYHGANPHSAPGVLCEDEMDLFERGSFRRPGVLGDTGFLAALPQRSSRPAARITLDHIVRAVALSLDVDAREVLSHSRRRELVRARALITWFALELEAATLSSVARYLRRDPSTLYAAVRHYKALEPQRFKLASFQDVT